jgi:hypothetical protein
MKNCRNVALAVAMAFAFALPSAAQDLVIYPAQGQSQQQLDQD